MVWLWILAVMAALLALLCLTRVGLLAELGETASADVTVGFLRFRVAPSKPGKKKPKDKKPDKKAEKPPEKRKKPRKKLPKPTKEDLKSAYHMLWGPSKRALRRFGRGIRIWPLELSVVLGGRDDPAAAAEQYGGLCAAVWTVMPQMEEWLDIRRPAIHMDVDFDAAALRARGRVGASMRIGTLLAIGLGLAVPGLRWLLRFMKAHQSDSKKNGPKESKPRADAPAQEPDAAA